MLLYLSFDCKYSGWNYWNYYHILLWRHGNNRTSCSYGRIRRIERKYIYEKKFTIILTAFILISNQTTAYAKDIGNLKSNPISANFNSEATVIYSDEDIVITELTEFKRNNSGIQTYSTKKYVSPSRKYNITSSSGKLLATFTLSATFTYDGKTASCTKSSYSTKINDRNISFTSATASKNGSTATGKYSLKIKNTGKTLSKTVSLKCSKNGTIS